MMVGDLGRDRSTEGPQQGSVECSQQHAAVDRSIDKSFTRITVFLSYTL